MLPRYHSDDDGAAPRTHEIRPPVSDSAVATVSCRPRAVAEIRSAHSSCGSCICTAVLVQGASAAEMVKSGSSRHTRRDRDHQRRHIEQLSSTFLPRNGSDALSRTVVTRRIRSQDVGADAPRPCARNYAGAAPPATGLNRGAWPSRASGRGGGVNTEIPGRVWKQSGPARCGPV